MFKARHVSSAPNGIESRTRKPILNPSEEEASKADVARGGVRGLDVAAG